MSGRMPSRACLTTAEAYYRWPISLTVPLACRLDPIEPHCKGKYVKAMWLLTDVPPSGQRLSYLGGSHTRKHWFATYADTRFTDEQVNGYDERVECAAPAESVIVFDDNGLHRGNRKLGLRRDTIFGNYTVGCHRIGYQFGLATFPYSQRMAEKHSPAQSHAVERILLKLQQGLRTAASTLLIST